MNIAHVKAAIVIPVHNEEHCLAPCLAAACAAAEQATHLGHPAVVIVVLDRCSDRSAVIASDFPVELIGAEAGSVGAARSLGAERGIALGATWLAFTDADSVVARDWLSAQLSLGADVVCGTVAISDWHLHDPQVRVAYETHYEDLDGHRHIHGANLGVSTDAYLACGGFDHVAVHEDVTMVQRLITGGFRVSWSARPRVWTSARVANRVEGGFGGFIENLCSTGHAENSSILPIRA